MSTKMAPAVPKFLMVRQLLELEQEDRLNLHPYFQRKLISPLHFKMFLVDSIFRGYPIPEVFMHVNKETGTYDIIDGQQRLNAIFEFLEGKFALQDHGSINALSPAAKKAFLDYPIAIRELKDVDDATVREIFRRLNTNVIVLTAQELRHARFTGPFIRLVEELAEDPFWTGSRVVSKLEADRMRDAEFVSELLLAMKEGPLDGRKDLSYWYDKYDVGGCQPGPWKKEFEETLKQVKTLFSGAGLAYSWRTKSNFYALFMAVRMLLEAGKEINLVPECQAALFTFIRLVKEEAKTPGRNSDIKVYFDSGRGGYDHKPNREMKIKVLYRQLLPFSIKA